MTLSLSRKLAVSLVLTVLVVSFFAVAAIDYVVSRDARQSLERKADEIIAYASGILEVPLWEVSTRHINLLGQIIAKDEAVAKLVVYDESGTAVCSIMTESTPDLISRSRVIYHKHGGSEVRVGKVEVSLSKGVYKERTRQLLYSSILIISAILISLITATGFLIRMFLKRPLVRLNEIADQYASGVYDISDKTIPYTEFHPFAVALEKMAGRITAQIRKVQDAEARYRNIFENAVEGIFQTTVEGRQTNVSPSLAAMLGYESPGELIESVSDIAKDLYVNPSRRDDLLRQLDVNDEVRNFETRLRRKDGTILWVSLNARAVRDMNGKIAGIEGFMSDITERKQAEEHLRKEARRGSVLLELYEGSPRLTEKDLYDYVLEQAVSLTDSAIGFFHLVSDDQKDVILTAWNMEALKNCTASYAAHYPIEAAGNWVDCVRLRRPVIYNDFEVSPNRKGLPEGHTPLHRFMSIPVVEGDKVRIIFGVGNKLEAYDDHDVIHIQLVANELQKIITQRRAEAALKAAQEELIRREKLSILGQLAGIVGHEIRNPLGVMNNAVYFLKTIMSDADHTVKEYLDMIEQEIGSAERIITDLLDFARTKTPQVARTSVGTMVTDTLIRCPIPENVNVVTDIPDTTPMVNIDPFQMGQVFQNLITNAVQAMPGGGTLRISARHVQGSKLNVQSSINLPATPFNKGGADLNVEHGTPDQGPGQAFNVEPNGDFIEISVEDTGEGISPEDMEKLFQPLFTTKAKGIGLGLVVCKNLVEANGGAIRAESRPGNGATFFMTFQFSGGENG